MYMNQKPQFHWNTGAPVARAEDENYTCIDTCDGCEEHAQGTMFHAAGATGRVCPVLFLCNTCMVLAPHAVKQAAA